MPRESRPVIATVTATNVQSLNMPRVFRVAVLECDKTIEPVRANRGQYVDIFRSLLTRALESEGHDIHLEVSQWDVVASQSYPRPEDFDGLLLSGSSMFSVVPSRGPDASMESEINYSVS